MTYQISFAKLKRIASIVREIIDQQQHARFDRAHFKEHTPESLIFEVVYYVVEPDFNLYMDVQHEINLEIFRRFEAERIDFGFPTTTVQLQKAVSAE